MKKRFVISFRRALLLALIGSSAITAAAIDKVLILDTTVYGGINSPEAQVAAGLGYQVDVVDATTWGGMTTAQFKAYRAIILGDPSCGSVLALAPAIANRGTWSPAVDGSVIVIGTDNDVHPPGGPMLNTNGIQFATSQSGKTGLYVSLSCYYWGTYSSTTVDVLDQFGTFNTIRAGDCFNAVHIVATHPTMSGLTDAMLSNWGCSVHEGFLNWPGSFVVMAIAEGAGTSYTASDFSVGLPYILVQGPGVVSLTNRLSLTPLEAKNPTNTQHTVCAKVVTNGVLAVGMTVTFTITSGPNVGTTGNAITGNNGVACFTYFGGGGVGTDTITAEIVDSQNQTITSDPVTKTWFDPCGESALAVQSYHITCDTNVIILTFNEMVSASTALDDLNYTLDQGLSVLSVSFVSGSQTTVIIEADQNFVSGTFYTLQISGITDLCGRPLTPDPTSLLVHCEVQCPHFLCPSNMVVQCTGPGGVPVHFEVYVDPACTNTTVICTPPSDSLFYAGITTVLCCVANGTNSSTNCCSFTVTVTDVLPPIIHCPSNIVVMSCTNIAVPFTVTAEDNCCPNPTVVCTPASNSLFAPGTNTVHCVATDCGTNTSSCDFEVIVLQDEYSGPPPTIVCPTNKTVPSLSGWTFDPPAAEGDVCCHATSVLLSSNVVSVTPPCQIVIEGVWRTTDCYSNSTVCTQTVTVVDSDPTTILCKPDKTVSCLNAWFFDPPAAAKPICCSVTNTLISSNLVSFTPPCLYVFRGVWLATDCNAMSLYCTQTVTVVDTAPPAVGCVISRTVPCVTGWHFIPPTVTDACCTNPTIVLISSNLVSFTPPCNYVFRGVWRATDCCSNTTTCTQIVTVVSTPPVFIGQPTPNLVPNPSFETYTTCPLYLSSTYDSQLTRAVPWISPTISSPDFLHSCAVFPSAGVPANFFGNEPAQEGSGYAGIYAYSDSYREYIETPLSSPLVGGQNYDISFYVSLADRSEYAVDNIGAHLSIGALPPPNPSYGNLPQTPQIRNPAGSYLSSRSGWTLIHGTYTAGGGENYLTIGNFYDNANTLLIYLPPPPGGMGSHFFNAYYYVDSVSVKATGASCGSDKTVECATAWSFDRPKVSGGCCSNSITVSLISSNLISSVPPCQYVYRGVWRATDCCSNSVYCTQTVTVADSIVPSICCPSDMTVYSCSNVAVVKWAAPRVTDNCSSGLQATCTPASGTVFAIGVTTVSCTATDACGNVGTCSFKVTVVGNQQVYGTKQLGIYDCYKNSYEDAPKSKALLSLPVSAWKPFDSAQAGAKFGATFDKLPNNIQCAQLYIRMKPICKETNDTVNDTISLGFTNYPPGPAKAAWTNYIGGGNPRPGLITNVWCNQLNCGQLFSLNLASLPNGSMNLLPIINATHRLDIFVEDATSVDYATLCYCYCPGAPLWRGLDLNLNNADFYRNCLDQLVISPGNVLTNATFGVSPGEMRGMQLDVEPLVLGDAANKVLTVTVQRTLDDLPDGIRLTGNGSGVMNLSLAALRTNVTQVQVILRSGTNVVAQASLAPVLASNLVSISGSAALRQITSTSAGNACQFNFDSASPVSILAGTPVSADSIELVMAATSSSPDNLIAGINFDISGLAEVTLRNASVLSGESVAEIAGDAVLAVSGDLLTLTPRDTGTNNPYGAVFGISGNPAQAGPIVIQPSATICRGTIDPRLVATSYGYFDGGPAPLKIGDVKFANDTNGWSIVGDLSPLGSSATRYQLYNQGTLVVDTGNAGNAAVSVADLPVHWKLSAVQSEGHFRLDWAESQSFVINNAGYLGDELRILAVGTNLLAYTLGAVAFEATGMDALAVSAAIPAPPVWTLFPPAITPAQMTIEWNGPLGGILESASSLFGPWAPVPGQIENSAVVGSPLTNGQPVRFFRVRSN